MNLKTLEQHNHQREDMYSRLNTYPQKNGIACSVCREELNDLDGMVLTSNPPRNIGCPSCAYHGYRVA